MKYCITGIILVASLFSFATAALSQDEAKPKKEVLTLEKCLELSKLRNNDILKAREELERTKGLVKAGYSAAWPKIDFNGSYTRVDDESIEEFEGVKFGTDESYRASFGLNQKIYSGGKVGAGIRAAKLADFLSHANLQTTTRNVELEVRERFYGVLLARDLIDVQIEAVKQFTDNLRNVEAKREEGQVSDYEVLRAKVALSNIQPDLIRSKNNYKLALDMLKQVLNMPLDTEIEVEGILSLEPMQFELDKLIETAMANRTEISAWEITLKLRAEQLVLAKAGMKPELSLSGDYSGQTETFGENDATDLQWGWSASLNLSMTLFDGFETKGKVMQAGAQYKQSKIDLESTKDAIELEVRRAYFKFNEAVEVFESQKKNVEQAEESVRQSQILADLGQVTQFALRDAQLELRTARTNLEKALHDYNVALARVRKAVAYDVERLNVITKDRHSGGGGQHSERPALLPGAVETEIQSFVIECP